MEILVIWSIVLLIAFGIGILIVRIINKIESRKVKLCIGICIALFFLFLALQVFFGEVFFTKSNAEEILKEHSIMLNDDFQFENKNIITGIRDYALQFDIRISKNDKERIIKQLANSPNRIHGSVHEMFDIRTNTPKLLNNDTTIYATYEETNCWNLQYCKIIRSGSIQTWDMIQIPQNGYTLRFIRNE